MKIKKGENKMFVGENYKNGIGTKEIVQKIRDYVKKYSDYTFSITLDKSTWTPDIKVSLVSGNKDITKNGTIEELNTIVGSINPYALEDNDFRKKPFMSEEVYNMLVDINKYVTSFRYDDSDIMTDYFDTNFYYDLGIAYDYQNKSNMKPRITEQSFVKTYKELWEKVNGAKMKMTRGLDEGKPETYVGTMRVMSNNHYLELENGKKIWGDKINKNIIITAKGFEKVGTGDIVYATYEFVD